MYRNLMICSVLALVWGGASWGQEAESGEEESPCSDYHTNEWGEYRCGLMPLRGQRLDAIYVEGLRPRKFEDQTGSYIGLGEEDLLIRNASNVADELRAVSGVGVSRSGGQGSLTQVRMRGAEANHTLVFLDGHEVSDPATGETDFGLLTGLPLRRVNILSGEQSAVHGSDAIGGVVGLSTGMHKALSGGVEFGERDTARGSLSGGFSPGDFSVTTGVSGFTTRGVDTAGLDGERDGASALTGMFTAHRRWKNGWSLRTLALYRVSEIETDPDSDFDGRLNDANRVTESEQIILGATLRSDEPYWDGSDHIIRASYNSVLRENHADDLLTDETVGERFKLSWSPSKKRVNRSVQQWFNGLIDYEHEEYERVSTSTLFGDPNQSQSFDTIGVAGEYRAKFRNGWNFNASARHDLNDNRFDDATTWRVGVARKFDFRRFDSDARLRASVGTGVKNPTFTELFGFFPGSFIGNPDLATERSLGWELGWEQTFDNPYINRVFNDEISYSATYFEAELKDEIFTDFFFDASTGTFGSTPANRAGVSQRSGVEFAAYFSNNWYKTDSYDLTLHIKGAVSFIESQNDQGADEVRVPSDTASLSFDLRAGRLNWLPTKWDEIRIGLAFDYVGEQLDTDFATFQTVALDPYTLVSATVEIPLSDRIAFTVRGENLFDEQAMDVVGYHSPGAGVFVGLKLRDW